MTKEEFALLETMKQALIDIRFICYENAKSGLSPSQTKLIADLADAVHGVPDTISNEEYDVDFQVGVFFKEFSDNYKGKQKCCKPFEYYQNVLCRK
jgi:hypothetical protein